MAAAKHNLTCEQGAFFTQQLLWKDVNGSPISLAGYDARMQVREQVNFDTVLIELTVTNGRITLEPAAATGTILLEIDAADTTSLAATVYDRKYVYDLELIPANGDVRRLMQGEFLVSLEVTR